MIFDKELKKVETNRGFQTEIEFMLQSAVVKQMSMHNKTFTGVSNCVSRNDNETDFLISKVDMDLLTD